MTPTQMRSLASDLDAGDMALPKTSGHGVHIMFGADALRAAADEVDRLRAENEHLNGAHASMKAQRDYVISAAQRLQAVIENAPHAADCDYLPGDEDYTPAQPCTCWKADAL